MDNEQQPADVLREYVELKAEIKEATERMEKLADIIKGFAEVDQVYELENATVSCVKGRATYQYSDELTERAEAVKQDQKVEVQMGTAKAMLGDPYLVVKFK